MSSHKQPQPLDLETKASVYDTDRLVSTIQHQVLRTPSFLAEVRVASRVRRPNLAGRRFLVVEDETLVGIDIVAGLEDAGAQVEGPIATVEKAIEIVERTSLDGALLAVKLNGRPVNEILSALIRRSIPFAFVTGFDRDTLPLAFRGVAILPMPFTHQQVLDAAAQLLQPETGR